jgi:hypothetical protein
MKRFLFPMLLVCAALASGCQGGANDNNANQAANQNGANINAGLIANRNAATATPTPSGPDPKNKAVLITISRSGSTNQVSVSPSTIYLSKGAAPRLHFYVFDDLDKNLTDFKIDFSSAKGNPMDGNYTVGALASGRDFRTPSQGLKADAATGTYKYTITVTIEGEPTPVTLDPDVEVGP